MDQAALEAAKALGSGNERFILAAAVLVLLGLAGWLGRALYTEIKGCGAQMLDIISKKIEADHKLADAIEGQTEVMKATLAQLRKA